MEEKEKLIAELKEKFNECKQKLGFKSTYEEINSVFYIEDMVLSCGYVSNQFSRQLINRMVDTFYGWIMEIYSWTYPQPMDIIHTYESKQLTSEERRELLLMIDRIMNIVRKNKRIAFDKLKEEGKFIDELVEFNKKHFNPFMLKYHKKFEELWSSEIKKNTENNKNH